MMMGQQVHDLFAKHEEKQIGRGKGKMPPSDMEATSQQPAPEKSLVQMFEKAQAGERVK
jgi:hypothetical protein